MNLEKIQIHKKTNEKLWFWLIFILILIPQAYLKLDFIDHRLTTVDIGTFIITVSIILSNTKKTTKTTYIYIIFIAYISFTLALQALSLSNINIEIMMYIIRSINVLALLLAAEKMPLNRDSFINFGWYFSLFSMILVSYSIFQYYQNNEYYFAHQTIYRADSFHNRLGGLTNETGAFSYNVAVIFQLLITFSILKLRNPLVKIAIIIASLIVIYFSYQGSLARIFLFNLSVFALALFIFQKNKLINILILSMTTLIVLIYLINIGIDEIQLLDTFRLNDFFAQNIDFNSLTSGRFDHWKNALHHLYTHPENIFLGAGHRSSNYILGHVIENFFLINIFEYGLIGFALIIAFYRKLLINIFRKSLKGDKTSIFIICIVSASFTHWMINDINTYYQTFPVLLFIIHWYSLILKHEKRKH
ncbi:MAG: hypothetical protein ACWA5P_03315 [bacterium]